MLSTNKPSISLYRVRRQAFLIGPFRENKEGRVASVPTSSSGRAAPSAGRKSAQSYKPLF